MENTLGRRISAARKKMGMTQDQLAEQLGVTAQAVSKWEHDQSCPDITMLPKLAGIFGITTDQLLGIAPDQEPPTVVAEVVTDATAEDTDSPNSGVLEFRYENSKRGGLTLALWAMLVGGILLACLFLHRSIGLWDIAWTSGLLVFGLMGLYPKFSVVRLGLALVGGYGLLSQFITLPVGSDLVLPVLLLLVGLGLLLSALRKPKAPKIRLHTSGSNAAQSSYHCLDGRVSCDISFSQQRYLVESPLLKGGEVDLSFGSLTLDLRGCQDFADDCVLELDCSFGDLTVLLPKTCQAELSQDTCFADVHTQGHPVENPQHKVMLDCDVSFGEIILQYV